MYVQKSNGEHDYECYLGIIRVMFWTDLPKTLFTLWMFQIFHNGGPMMQKVKCTLEYPAGNMFSKKGTTWYTSGKVQGHP